MMVSQPRQGPIPPGSEGLTVSSLICDCWLMLGIEMLSY